MWSVSDETLYAGLAAGDRDATDAFVARFQRRVYGLARSITGDDRLAEDVAQEALVRAWRHASAYDPRRGSVATWLLTITRNLAIDEIRVRRPAAYDPEVLIATAPPSGERGPADVAVVGEDVLRLQRALATLPGGPTPRHRARGCARAERPGGRGARGHPAGHRQDADPRRDDPAADAPGRRGACRMTGVRGER